MLALIIALFTTQSMAATLINGAGATFPFPLYSKWFAEYQKEHEDVQINYQSIGSGGGIRQFTEATVDFGASDAPMNDEQISKVTDVLHIPTTLGAVVVTYNLPEVKAPLKLSGEVIADIFLGKITQWNAEPIAKLNAGVKLPDTAILVAHRSDGSGTSAVFTDFLSKVSPAWKEKVGTGTAVNWPAGLGGKGNEGVAGLVKQTPGTIGYVELVFAANNGLAVAEVQNKAGKFVTPSPKSVTAAADASLKMIPEDFRISITNAEGKDAYPISAFTYILVHEKSKDADKGKKMKEFLLWALHGGQKFAEPLSYAPLPKQLVSKAEAKVKKIQVETK